MRQGLTAAVVALLALAACGGDGEPLDISAADSGATVSVETGQSLVITLESNLTTGFQWNLVGEPEAGVLTLVGSEYIAPEDGAVGEGGVEVWTFEGKGAGTTALELSYFRPFDTEDVQGSFTLTVDVS
jgi:inhibitor of cysteine peptidase